MRAECELGNLTRADRRAELTKSARPFRNGHGQQSLARLAQLRAFGPATRAGERRRSAYFFLDNVASRMERNSLPVFHSGYFAAWATR